MLQMNHYFLFTVGQVGWGHTVLLGLIQNGRLLLNTNVKGQKSPNWFPDWSFSRTVSHKWESNYNRDVIRCLCIALVCFANLQAVRWCPVTHLIRWLQNDSPIKLAHNYTVPPALSFRHFRKASFQTSNCPLPPRCTRSHQNPVRSHCRRQNLNTDIRNINVILRKAELDGFLWR